MPSSRAAWVRVTAAVLAAVLVASMGFSALTLVSAPGWTVALLLIGVVGLLIGVVSSGTDQPGR